MKKIVAEYQFGKLPDLNKIGTDQGRTFRDGRIFIGNKQVNIKEMSVYNDGIVLAASTTGEAQLAVDHILKWVQQNLGFREIQSEPQKRYSSTVVVEFDKPMDRLIKNLNAFTEIAIPLLKDTYGIDVKPQLYGIEIAVDPEDLPKSLILGDFRLQRRVNVPFSSERFLSHAPLPNEAHLHWLKAVERLA